MKSLGLPLCAAFVLLCLPAVAQDLGPQLQKATISGHGSVITIRRLPVRTPDGVVYRDITIELQLDPSGAIRADASGAPGVGGKAAGKIAERASAPAVIARELTIGPVTDKLSAPEVAAHFIPGTYKDDVGGGLVQVISEGRRDFDRFPTYALSLIGGDTTVSAAEWYAGPISVNPHKALIARAKVDSDLYSYGVIVGSGSGNFDQGMLIGAVQNGNRLTLFSFHRRGCCTYSSVPTSQVGYTLVGR